MPDVSGVRIYQNRRKCNRGKKPGFFKETWFFRNRIYKLVPIILGPVGLGLPPVGSTVMPML